MEDNRRFKSTDEMMNCVFGSVPLSDEQRRQKEAEHKAAQVPKPPAPEPPKPKGWMPKGVVTTNTDSLAFRNNMAPPTEAELQRGIAKTMMGVVGDARRRR
jgi:hypothetical protein